MGTAMQVVLRVLWLALALDMGMAYKKGDAVQMSKRISHNKMVSAWHDVPFTNSPVFGETSAWVVPGVNQEIRYTSDTKLSFSFAHDSFATPWQSLRPSVNIIRFRFSHAGGAILDLKAEQFGSEYSAITAKAAAAAKKKKLSSSE